MPQLIEADDSEVRLLATVSLYPELFSSATVAAEDFRDFKRRSDWQKIATNLAAGVAVIPDDYTEWQVKAGVNSITPLPQFVAEDARRVSRAAYRRNALSHATDIAKAAYDDGDIAAAIEQGTRLSIPSSGTLEGAGAVGLRTLERYGNKDALQALLLPTGLRRWDKSMGGGLENNTATIIGARPSMGKTAVLCQIADYVSECNKVAVFFSKEMPAEQIFFRMACRRAGVSYKSFVEGSSTEEEDKAVLDWVVELSNRKTLFIDDSDPQDISAVEGECKRIKKEMGALALILADHLRLFKASGDNEMRRLANISWQFKRMVKPRSLDTRALVAVQLSRDVVKRGGDLRPDMQDIRECGEIEENADNIAMVHRPDYYDETIQDHTIELINRKSRNGERNSRAVFRWVGHCMSTEEMEPNAQQPTRNNPKSSQVYRR